MKKVVSATLAGALAVGMVPAMALADDAIELQATTEVQSINGGSIIAFAGSLPADKTFVAGDADALEVIKPTAVKAAEPAVTEYDVFEYRVAVVDPTATSGFDANYTADGKPMKVLSWLTVDTLPTTAGNYAIFAKAKHDADDSGVIDDADKASAAWVLDGVSFTVLPKAIGELVAYEPATSIPAQGIFDTEFVYDGKNVTFGENAIAIASDGKPLVKDTDYTAVGLYDAKTNLEVSDYKAAGEYYVLCQFGAAYVKVPYTVKKLNIDNAKIELAKDILVKGTDTAVAIAEINDATFDPALNPYIQIESVSANLSAPELGPIEVTVGLTAAGKANASIEGTSQKLAATVVAADVSSALNLTYTDVAALATYTADGVESGPYGGFDVDYTVDRTQKVYSEFDAAKLAVAAAGTAYTDYTLEVTKWNAKTGKWDAAKVEDITDKAAYGVYNVKAVLNAAGYGYKVAGETKELTVEVINGAIETAGVAFAYQGKNVTATQFDGANALVYSGVDFVDGLEVVVKVGGKVVPASDYSVVVKKYNTKTAVYDVVTDGIVNVGDYKVEVVSTKYAISGDNAIYVDVDPVAPKTEYADQVDKTTGCQLLFTGEEVNPIAGFTVADGPDADTARDIIDVPASAYKLTITEFTPEGATKPVLKKDLPTEFVEAGLYRYTIEDADDKDNYSIATENKNVRITAKNVFPDVKVEAWYADEVLAVAQNGWITGYDNGLFGPNDGMKRGDLALVLGRALGMDVAPLFNGSTNTIIKVVTGFEDVDGGAYYARAIKAVAEAGIMTGYDDGTYGANDLVTRQQLATILARVDASGLGDASILASALDAYVDGDEVAGWAASGVEWAVENGIMGVDTAYLNPGDTVSRAEVAAMLVRYDAVIGGLEPVVLP